NSHIGLIRDQNINILYKNVFIEVQDRLFTVGAILATPPEKEIKKNGEKRLKNLGILETDIEFLEKDIDLMEDSLPPMTHFVLPGGHTTVSYCHIARCVCRR
ncbi:ATP:cob(I)alamin adenosyltransferase, partial [Flavobacterium sp. j3]